MKRGRKKKAISPLIATVILVGFAVALGALVSSFVIKQSKEFKVEAFLDDSPYCDNVVVQVLTDPNNPPCAQQEAGSIYTLQNIKLKNKGSFSIPRMTISAPGQDSQVYLYRDPTTNAVTPLPPGAEYANVGIAFINEAATINADPLIKIQPNVRDLDKTLEAKENNPGAAAVIIPCARKEIQFNLLDLCPGGTCTTC